MFVEYIVMIQSRRQPSSPSQREYQRNVYRALDLSEARLIASKLRKQNFSNDLNVIEREAEVFAEFGMRGAKYRVRVSDFREFVHDVQAAMAEIDKDTGPRAKLAITGTADGDDNE